LMLGTFPETRWLAAVMGMNDSDSDSSAPEVPAPEPPASDAPGKRA
jgi:hypothetical protein